MKRVIVVLTALATALALAVPMAGAKSSKSKVNVNVSLSTDITASVRAELDRYGRITGSIEEIDAVFMKARLGDLDDIRALPFVAAVNPDAERKGSPVDTVAADDFTNGLNTWNLDAIDVTQFAECDHDGKPATDPIPCGTRAMEAAGSGVYVAVLDTGLVDQWRQYFPEERIATQYGISFGGGGGERGNVSTQPNKWEHDTNSHGTHVTSTILGYSLGGAPINGVAPQATVIPVKVLGNSGFGWSSMVAAGITYVGDLASCPDGPLCNDPVVINMSLGGPELDTVEKDAIDYAISQGVIIVASAGNEGNEGMGYPGAYQPVISAAAYGWVGEWLDPGPPLAFNASWWNNQDVEDPTDPSDFYITDFSSRELRGQDLDVAAPGSWVVGPFNLQQGNTSYFFLGGTSMASPHVAGTVALMLEKNGNLTASQAERILEGTAIGLPAGERQVLNPNTLTFETIGWRANATGSGLMNSAAALAATP